MKNLLVAAVALTVFSSASFAESGGAGGHLGNVGAGV